MTVDTFANKHNTQLRWFASLTPHPKAVGVVGLLLDYREERAYCFPPPRLLAVLLVWQASAVVVVPHRPGAPWWPLWLQGTQATMGLESVVVPYLRHPRSFVPPLADGQALLQGIGECFGLTTHQLDDLAGVL